MLVNFYGICFTVFMQLAWANLNPSKVHLAQVEREKSRKLIYDTGNNRDCFDTNYNRGYADYLLDPFLANGNRGDWGENYALKIMNCLSTP